MKKPVNYVKMTVNITNSIVYLNIQEEKVNEQKAPELNFTRSTLALLGAVVTVKIFPFLIQKWNLIEPVILIAGYLYHFLKLIKQQ